MKLLDWLMPRSITAQITSLVAVSVLVGVTLLVVIILLVTSRFPNDRKGTLAHVAEITTLMRAADTPAAADTLLSVVQRADPSVRRVAVRDLVPAAHGDESSLTRVVLRQFAPRLGISLLTGLHDPAGPRSQVISRLNDDEALVFNVKVDKSLLSFLLTPTALLVIIIIVSMLLMSFYAVRWVVAPLAAVANAAATFGRTPQNYEALSRTGPHEIIQVTDALNEMRTRIRALLDDRSRMLAAISHDLRTPLTRLRLRTERVPDLTLRTAMLGDITTVSRMLDETLEFLRDDAQAEGTSRIDLPSFLQTICSDFSDMGHAVSYDGPARMPFQCRPRALSRALTNIVENAVKHAGTVTVALAADADNGIRIDVIDDGPGIAAGLYEKVFEPFFKADNARGSGKGNNGFGLGLSIARDIIKRHGGSIEMKPHEPTGLRVAMVMPTQLL
jgi:signal transduction histidine kinase